MDRGTVAKKSRKRRNSNTDNTSQQENEPVYFSNDTILEAVKFLNYVKWSQMRFLCHRVNQLIHSNQANLQAFEVKSLSMSEYPYKSNSIVSFDQGIQSPNAMRKWFQDRGYSCDETTDMPLEKVFVGMNLSKGNGLHLTIRAFFEDFTEKNMPLTRSQAKQMRIAGKVIPSLSNGEILRSKSYEVFSAEFNAKYEFYGPILSHFFRLLHHPAAYFREVSMFPPMTDKFCDMTSHSPIRCNQFTLLDSHSSLSYISLKHSLKWLKDNVRAQNITLFLNENNNFPYPDVHSLVSEFFLQNASICAQDRIKLDRLLYPEEFVKNLIKKYETLEVTNTIPSIVLEFRFRWNQSSLEFFLRDLDPMDYPPLYDKCDSCDIKTYGRQMDGNRKMIAQFGRCFGSRCLYYGSICCMRFE
ncbi:hypothetical protein Ddc_24146 [Ditylenchus destructor]|nr:hypothetical protein Ddc_24146 [Ditylenchus destructor]